MKNKSQTKKIFNEKSEFKLSDVKNQNNYIQNNNMRRFKSHDVYLTSKKFNKNNIKNSNDNKTITINLNLNDKEKKISSYINSGKNKTGIKNFNRIFNEESIQELETEENYFNNNNKRK